MNICQENHEPKYQIIYKSAKGGEFIPVWLVCDSCMENKKHFGSNDEVLSVKRLA